MIEHRTAQKRLRGGTAIRSKKLPLISILLAMLVITGCSGTTVPTPEPSATSSPVPSAATTPSPAALKPTATFVPLITPSPTPEGGALTNATVPRIDVQVAKQMAEAGEAILVDVRTQATYQQAHIAGAISMPAGEVLDRYAELPTDKLVIFY